MIYIVFYHGGCHFQYILFHYWRRREPPVCLSSGDSFSSFSPPFRLGLLDVYVSMFSSSFSFSSSLMTAAVCDCACASVRSASMRPCEFVCVFVCVLVAVCFVVFRSFGSSVLSNAFRLSSEKDRRITMACSG